MGRIEGPYQAPAKWHTKAVDPHGGDPPRARGLLPAPADDACYCAIAFPIEQTSPNGELKIRRGEDWRRSHHNRLARTYDKPVHYTIDHHVEAVHATFKTGLPEPVSWGQDHEGAYRQLPARPLHCMFVLLITDAGPTLWRHRVTMFGSKAAVWAYNRFADAIMHLSRTILLCSTLHYVDDFTAIEARPLAASGFAAFEDLSGLLGVVLKQTKRQPPTVSRETLGVVFKITDTEVLVQPKPSRRTKLLMVIRTALEVGVLSGSDADKHYGKLNFYNTAVFGNIGRAALRPLYRRANFGGRQLTVDIKAALNSILHVLSYAPPRRVPVGEHEQFRPVLYADAFFELGDSVFNVST
jgi:hypothetical protein